MEKVTIWENGFPLCFSESDDVEGDIIPSFIKDKMTIRKLIDGSIIDASSGTEFYIDEHGRKLIEYYPDTIKLKCGIHDALVKTKEGWKVALTADIIKQKIIEIKRAINFIINQKIKHTIDNYKYKIATDYNNECIFYDDLTFLAREAVIRKITIKDLVNDIISQHTGYVMIIQHIELKRIRFNIELRERLSCDNLDEDINQFIIECQKLFEELG